MNLFKTKRKTENLDNGVADFIFLFYLPSKYKTKDGDEYPGNLYKIWVYHGRDLTEAWRVFDVKTNNTTPTDVISVTKYYRGKYETVWARANHYGYRQT